MYRLKSQTPRLNMELCRHTCLHHLGNIYYFHTEASSLWSQDSNKMDQQHICWGILHIQAFLCRLYHIQSPHKTHHTRHMCIVSVDYMLDEL